MLHYSTTNIPEGQFDSLPLDDATKSMLNDGYRVISELTLWDWLKNPDVPGNKSFMFCEDPNIAKITQTMYTDHTGASFGFTMRTLEFIAKNGWDAYVNRIST